ncbi:hypothetical protein ACSHXN_02595 [Streptomyces sp. HUAS TT11]|uniref:hypothetical protein n=1 Tax=Streptomyces sp. HUAS TT11 TaxID=3447508 RepID=UPI003F65A6A7
MHRGAWKAWYRSVSSHGVYARRQIVDAVSYSGRPAESFAHGGGPLATNVQGIVGARELERICADFPGCADL